MCVCINYYILGAALHYYFMHVHVLPADFITDRYMGEDKLKLLTKLRAICPRGADKFLKWFLEQEQEKGDSKLIKAFVGRGNRAGIHHYRIMKTQLVAYHKI